MSITEFDEKAFEEMLREEGRKEGREEGTRLSLIKLVKEGIISMEVAANQLSISAEEMQNLVNK